MIQGKIISLGTIEVLAGWRCDRCMIETRDPKSPTICPRAYHKMKPIYIQKQERIAI